MAQTTISIKIDEDTKKEFDLFCSEVGLNISTAFNLFAKAVIREKRIPFDITVNTPNAETIAVIEEINQGKNLSKSFDNINELMEDLNA